MSKQNEEYGEVTKLVQEMLSSYNAMKDAYYKETEEEYKLKKEVLESLIRFTPSELEQLPSEQVNVYYDKYAMEAEDDVTEETKRERLKQTKELSSALYDLKAELNSILSETNSTIHEIETEKSQKRDEALRKKLDELKEKMDSEEFDDTMEESKERMQIMIDSIESALSMEFIFERIKKYGDKELEKVMEGFFDAKVGAYVISKFKSKMHMFGYSDNLYMHFFNLEENFLPEDLHVFNNIFLYMYMRFVAYADPYNKAEKMRVNSLTNTISNLIYHKFPQTDAEKRFLAQLEKYDRFYEKYRDKFEAENTTAPKNPVRIAAENKREAEMRALLLKKIEDYGFTGYDENWTAKELQEFFNSKLDERVEANKKEKDLGLSSESEENASDEESTESPAEEAETETEENN